jgi:hypothetical protein
VAIQFGIGIRASTKGPQMPTAMLIEIGFCHDRTAIVGRINKQNIRL